MVPELIALATIAVWIYLLAGRGGFWRAAERDTQTVAPLRDWPAVTAVIPARNEAETVGECITSLLRQEYPGRFSVVLVDDVSSDDTADVARRAAQKIVAPGRLTVLRARSLPVGWTGKLWAVNQGVEHTEQDPPAYLLLTDADIVFAPDVLHRLVASAERDGLVLNSLVAKLRCTSFAERSLTPAFIFFFQMLYPFAWVNRPNRRTAAAAGGCMLVRTVALRSAGGIESIRGALIDDCALARKLNREGPIWLALTDRVESIRAYPAFSDIRRMVSRSAFTQLRYSWMALAGAILGMSLAYIAPVLLVFFGHAFAKIIGIIAWIMMAGAFQPTLLFYRRLPLWGPVLPVIALAYMAFTLASAYQYARGTGGVWKGRVQAGLQ
jgi:hopene-associated glycosyltransferase HpnB